MTKKICKDCIHCEPTFWQKLVGDYKKAKCVYGLSKDITVDQFTGKETISYRNCDDMRNANWGCDNWGWSFNITKLHYHNQDHIKQMMDEADMRKITLTRPLKVAS